MYPEFPATIHMKRKAKREFKDMPSEQKARIFLKERFKQPQHEGYIQEWISRFESGHPKAYMDLESERLFEKLMSSKKKIKEVV